MPLVSSLLRYILTAIIGIGTAGVLVVAFVLFSVYPHLPSLDALTDYRPKIPLRIYTSDNELIGEFGEERRNVVKIQQVPKALKQAILAAEDDRFYEHSGIDYVGILRAGLTNIANPTHLQGASTITMQVARNFYLSSERSLKRKLLEVMLTYKIENNLTKDQILELYINQIYLGQRSYGFATAAQTYYGKNLSELSIAESAMLAGLPKAPSAYNPVVNPKRAKIRQGYVLSRMHYLKFIDDKALILAQNEEPKLKSKKNELNDHAEYAAELVRQMVYETFQEETYTRGMNVYTTLNKSNQEAAYRAVRKGVLDYDKRHGYRGPEGFVEITQSTPEWLEIQLGEFPDSDDLKAAIVLSVTPKTIQAYSHGSEYTLQGDGLKFVQSALQSNAIESKRIKRGSIIRIASDNQNKWSVTQLPEVEAAFVSASPQDGAVRALVGGFDFSRSKFNHVNQAWRQPGSSFKPFIYSASLEKGFTPSTMVNDAPFSIDSALTGGQVWEPKNYDGKYDGPMTIRRALARSKNMVTIRVMQSIGVRYAQDYITKFGFDAEKHPPYLTTALGAGSVTPWQMLGGYSILANGGYKVQPYIISKITDNNGKILAQAQPKQAGDEQNRAIDARNAFIMESLLKDVVRVGTATKALSLKRNDLAGKTGTTNDHVDAWFAGFQGNLVGIAWMGFDQPIKKLGNGETGGQAALPIWIDYMSKALATVPDFERAIPEGISQVGSEYYYSEFIPVRAEPAAPSPESDPITNLLNGAKAPNDRVQ
jgi:penicillin-binding protein 1A